MNTAGSSTENSRESLAVKDAEPSPAIVEETPVSVDLYLLRTRKSRSALFLTRRGLDVCAAHAGHSVRRGIRRLLMSRYSVVRRFGQLMRAGNRYYQKLEDRIDPQERMVKALNSPQLFKVWHGGSEDPATRFRDFLRAQAMKHAGWLIVDGMVTLVALLLMPIPGPNVLGWYPFLRGISHFRALTGVRRVYKKLHMMQYLELSDLVDLEKSFDRESFPQTPAERVHLEGLEQFLSRVG